ncbi:MAG: Ribulose-phosphate 3-epimerase [Candidatus Daviesbacteria bacterium GW2011_GWA2_38_24]|uniref:Ribulose-phosphate 3-epimerase n=1 Tax=Candidatus Daviesbacteria bacterium GW2011_GWA2_38_24 TaxID=1618422 RepID=A0A0G0M113_9BACT|nr:MAG: Ribulose-phosphate 3-epimerase [Candidatus Daviesbacteria bacterium GW2011_GWA2_38_24]KKQ77920.1 MAG: Ribulose-phosphate 3-epimerase [Candidatus Daviesbacteria bacterium GW2011_GWA1_38_7]OGE23628.1 MAG: hypothetical protein A2688_00505 [Candidatus Daviesbacteria bacterium RIFCSPHIGHO2_01_FULL_38_8]
MIQIIPAILATTEKEYHEQLEKIISADVFQEGWIQIDIMDNKFVQNKSIGFDVIAKYPESFKKEIQLLVEDPTNWLEQAAYIDAHFMDRVIAPVEVGALKIEKYLNKAKELRLEVGLSVNPKTPIESLVPFVDKIRYVVIMSVEPGFQGQQFITDALEKVKKVKSQYSLTVGVDGGINSSNVRSIVDAGADYLAVGSGLLKGDIDANLEKFWEALSL